MRQYPLIPFCRSIAINLSDVLCRDSENPVIKGWMRDPPSPENLVFRHDDVWHALVIHLVTYAGVPSSQVEGLMPPVTDELTGFTICHSMMRAICVQLFGKPDLSLTEDAWKQGTCSEMLENLVAVFLGHTIRLVFYIRTSGHMHAENDEEDQVFVFPACCVAHAIMPTRAVAWAQAMSSPQRIICMVDALREIKDKEEQWVFMAKAMLACGERALKDAAFSHLLRLLRMMPEATVPDVREHAASKSN